MFSASPESTLHGGPLVPPRYQSLSGTYLGASPSSQPLTMSTRLTDLTL